MTVAELEREFVLGQKWAVECENYICERDTETGLIMDTVQSEIVTIHYKTGEPKRCPYFNFDIRYVRVVDDEIYIIVRNLINEK